MFDDETTVRGTAAMSARGAAILSLIHLASSVHFVMKSIDGQLQLDEEKFQEAMQAVGTQPFVSYGFTYVLYQASPAVGLSWLDSSRRLARFGLSTQRWLETDAAAERGKTGLQPRDRHCLGHRGTAGRSTFMASSSRSACFYPDCSEGLKHAPYWAEVVIREADSLRAVPVGGDGLIQLVNCLPLSGPNHSVLTEDLGRLVLEDGCACGRRGRAFRFIGRAPRAEVRGCSDVGRR